MRPHKRALEVTALALGALGALLVGGGCSSSVGEGTGPSSLTVKLDGNPDAATVIECSTLQLAAELSFEGDGGSSTGDYASRVQWSSSDDTVVSVSNGDLVSGGSETGVYIEGIMVARRPGTATITADYLDEGLSDRFTVNVIELDQLTITPVLDRLVPESFARFELEGTTASGFPANDLGAELRWTFNEVNAPADVDPEGQSVTVLALEGPEQVAFTLEARIDSCDRSVTRELQIESPSELQVRGEQPADLPLPSSLVEAIQVIATFSDGQEQNLSSQVELEQTEGSGGDADLSLYGDGEPDDVLLLTPRGDDDDVEYEFCYDPLDLCATSRLYTLRDIDWVTLRAEPQDLLLTYPEEAQLKAYAQFEDGVERDVTRTVTWANDNLDALTVGGEPGFSGEITTNNVDQDATVIVGNEEQVDETEVIDIRVFSREP